MLSLTCRWRAARSKGSRLGDSVGVVAEKVGRKDSGGGGFCEGVGVVLGGIRVKSRSKLAVFLLTCRWRAARSKGSRLGDSFGVVADKVGRRESGGSGCCEGVGVTVG